MNVITIERTKGYDKKKEILSGQEVLLMNAIIKQACDDYANAYMGKLPDGIKNKSTDMVMRECEDFFHSEYYKGMTEIDGDYLIRRSKYEALDKEIGIYKEILSVGRCGRITLRAPKKGNKPAISHMLPPVLEEGIKQALQAQLEELEEKSAALKEEGKRWMAQFD